MAVDENKEHKQETMYGKNWKKNPVILGYSDLPADAADSPTTNNDLFCLRRPALGLAQDILWTRDTSDSRLHYSGFQKWNARVEIFSPRSKIVFEAN